MNALIRKGVSAAPMAAWGILLICLPAWAGEGDAGWRSTYDTVMLWVNFSILAFVAVKFGKAPIMNLLRSQKDEIAGEIEKLEKEREQMIARIDETRQALTESDARFNELKERIVARGKNRKEVIIEEAREQSQLMIEAAKKKIDFQIVEAKRLLRDELIDTAIDMAGRKLPSEIRDEDNDRLLDLFMSKVTAK